MADAPEALQRDNRRLRAENRRLRAENRELRAENERLARRVAALEARVAELTQLLDEARRAGKRQAAPFSRGEPTEDPKPPGQRPGHPGTYRMAPAHVDETMHVPLRHCPQCGGPVEERRQHEQFVTDLPPVRPQVRRYVTESGYCPRCRRRVRSHHPDQISLATGAAGSQVGPHVVALAAALKHGFGVPYRKVAGVLLAHFGVRVTAGALVLAEHRLAARAEPAYQTLVLAVRQSAVVHADETGWRIGGQGAWLWVFCTRQLTVYAIRQSRGADVVQELLGVHFAGVLTSDCFLAYDPFDGIKQKCFAHLLRTLSEIEALKTRGAVRFPRAVAALLRQAMALKAQRAALPAPRYAARGRRLEARLDRLLAGRYTDPDNRRFANRLRKQRRHLFTFLSHHEVEPTNNRAERQIRPAVVVRKISAGNRTAAGAHTHEVLTSLLATFHEHGRAFVPWAVALLRAGRGSWPKGLARLPPLRVSTG
jgi:hypothetical protein